MTITFSSHLTLVPIKIRQEKKHFIVEDLNSGDFYEMPKVCIDAIEMINGGEQLGYIEQQLKDKFPEEEIDLIDFSKQLLDLDLIEEIDGEKVEKYQKKQKKLGFRGISPKVGKFFFNKAAYFFYLLLFILNVSLLLTFPKLIPHYKDLFISDLMVLNIPAWLFITVCTMLIHEFGHILAMRSQNLPTKMEVGHRLFLVVLETDMSSVWKLPSKERNVLYLAGICFDMVVLSIALLSQLIWANGSGIFLSIMAIIVLDIFIRLVYQLCVYMKTDLYYVIENVSGCYNLMENAQVLITKKLPFLKSKGNEEVVFTSEKKTVFLYTIFYFVGVVLMVSLYFIFYIPQLVFAFKKVIPGFTVGPAALPFWDAALFTLQIILGFGLLFYSWRKKYATR